MPQDYFESIAITAFDRKEYYTEAVDSALRQVKGRPDVEIILIKNFVEEHVDRRLENQGVRICFDSSPTVGSTLRRAFELANGKYIGFLDDDDLFKRSKMARFEQVLRQYPDLGYYHHGFEYSVQSKAGLGAWDRLTHARTNRRQTRPALRAFQNSHDPGIFGFLAARNQERNLSSAVVHRDVVAKVLPVLDSLPAMTDTIMLIAALLSTKTLVFDEAVESIVRRHRENSSNGRKNLDARVFVLNALAQLCADTKATSGVRDYLNLRAAREIVFQELVWGKYSRAATRDATQVLARYYRTRRAPRDLAYCILGGMESVFPGLLPLLRPLAV